MADQSSMVFGTEHNLLLSVQTAREPGPNEWRRYLSAIARRENELCGILVLQLAGWPSFRRLRQLRQSLAGKRKVRVAFMSASSVQRATLTGLSWLADWDAAAFEPHDLPAGLDFLIQGDSALLREDVGRTLQQLSADLHAKG